MMFWAGFAQPGNIDIQRQAAFDTGLQYRTYFFFIAERLVTENRDAGSGRYIKMGNNIDVGCTDHPVQFIEIIAIDFVGGVGSEIFSIEHEIPANKMDRADHIVERSPLKHFSGFLRIQVRFGNFDPGTDNQFPGEKAA